MPTEQLKRSDLMLISLLLDMADNQFSNHGCNDLFDEFWSQAGLTEEDKRKLMQEMREYNNPDDEWPERLESVGDSSLMGFYAAKLKQLAEATDAH